MPISLKELNVTKVDLKKLVPKLSPKKYETVLYNTLIKVFDGYIKNEKSELIKEIENDIRNDNY